MVAANFRPSRHSLGLARLNSFTQGGGATPAAYEFFWSAAARRRFVFCAKTNARNSRSCAPISLPGFFLVALQHASNVGPPHPHHRYPSAVGAARYTAGDKADILNRVHS